MKRGGRTDAGIGSDRGALARVLEAPSTSGGFWIRLMAGSTCQARLRVSSRGVSEQSAMLFTLGECRQQRFPNLYLGQVKSPCVT